MAVGNSWIYGSSGISADTQECSVFDTARVAGGLYFLHSGPTLELLGNWSSPVDSLRSDTLLRIWRRDKGLEYMLFDFSHGDYPSYTTYPEVDTVRVTQNVDVRALRKSVLDYRCRVEGVGVVLRKHKFIQGAFRPIVNR